MKAIFLVFTLFFFSATANACTHYTDLVKLVEGMGWTVTSTTGGKHNVRSKHYQGRAIDVSVRNRTEFHIAVLRAVLEPRGFIVVDERKRPKGQKVWSAPHLHIVIPVCY